MKLSSVLHLHVPLHQKVGLNALNPRFQVDGENVVSLTPDRSVTVAFPPGPHRVRALISLQFTSPLDVALGPGEEAHIVLRFWPNPFESGWWRILELSQVGTGSHHQQPSPG